MWIGRFALAGAERVKSGEVNTIDDGGCSGGGK